MNTSDDTLIPHSIMAELREAADKAAKGLRDLEAARQACERMDRMREKNRQLFGEQDVGVEIIRAMRDGR
jgi:rRNA-processing protein FCF1